MSKLTERLRKIRIFNLCGLVEEGHPAIYYRSQVLGRGYIAAAWVLFVKGEKFKNVPWCNNGRLVFLVCRHGRQKGLELAFAKCKELFPEIKMVKAPFRMSYIPEEDLKEVMAKLKAFEKETGK